MCLSGFVAGPKLQEMMQETRTLLEVSSTKLMLPRMADHIYDLDPSQYSLSIIPPANRRNPSFEKLIFKFGEHITVRWTAPPNHSRRDWIGVYAVGANANPLLTGISSKGRWHWVCRQEDEDDEEERDGSNDEGTTKESEVGEMLVETEGKVTFRKETLPWEVGTYEFRYHHDGKHHVMTTSAAFTIVGMYNTIVGMYNWARNVANDIPTFLVLTPYLDNQSNTAPNRMISTLFGPRYLTSCAPAWTMIQTSSHDPRRKSL